MDLKKYHLLYVDDEESNLRIFKTSFKRRYTVHTASSGAEGLKILEEHPIHLILTDQKMPEMTGVEFLKEVLQRFPDPIRIIVTGFSDTESIVNAINECGIYQYVTKPWKNEEIQFVIDKALEAYKLKSDNNSLMEQLTEANQDLEYKVILRTQELQKSRDLLADQHKKIKASINYALRIQNAMLPQPQRFNSFFPNSFILFQPRDVISGDFYWLDMSPEGEILLALADCTGHGVPGAFMTLIGNELLNSITNAEQVYKPNKVLERLHQQVIISLRQGDDDNTVQDGMDIALCKINLEEKEMQFAAGKNSMVIIKNGKMEEIKGDKHSIGGTKGHGEEPFNLHTIDMNEKASYYLFTDGYIDQFGGPENRKFMRKSLKDLLLSIHTKPMEEQGTILKETMNKWMGSGTQIDDISIIGFEI